MNQRPNEKAWTVKCIEHMRKSLQPGVKRFQGRKRGREGRQTTKENTDKLDLKLKTSAHQIVPLTKEKGNL